MVRPPTRNTCRNLHVHTNVHKQKYDTCTPFHCTALLFSLVSDFR